MSVVSQLEVSNLAIAHLPAKPISSVNESSLEARECARFYPRVVADMLDREHHWSFANQRVALALLGSNDREHEWAYAYALPSNMGSPIRVIPDFESLGVGLPVPLPGEPYAEIWSTSSAIYETPYVIEGSTLYTHVESAVLEYAINDLSGLNVAERIITAMALDLAARLAVPVKKDSERETKLANAAEAAWQRAIADDQNRHPQMDGQYVSEAMMARRGYLTEAP